VRVVYLDGRTDPRRVWHSWRRCARASLPRSAIVPWRRGVMLIQWCGRFAGEPAPQRRAHQCRSALRPYLGEPGAPLLHSRPGYALRPPGGVAGGRAEPTPPPSAA